MANLPINLSNLVVFSKESKGIIESGAGIVVSKLLNMCLWGFESNRAGELMCQLTEILRSILLGRCGEFVKDFALHMKPGA